ncbi:MULTISPECIES: integrase family protein [unclassified Azospirillum]|uniref:tyrosine-type recombinase/integrase n=1 Tax=unclassified Azospirillum TaxID=2630922 RepID=UPI001304CFEF|nr:MULTISPECIES: integrase family protein [unclassified Azospirillum]
MPEKVKFTKSFLDRLPAPTEEQVGRVGYVTKWDSDIPGFAVQLRATGVITFVLHYRFKGRARKCTIGQYGKLTLDHARNEAKVAWGKIARGDDPAAEKLERRRAGTLGDLFDAYLEEYVKKGCSLQTVRSVERVRRMVGKELWSKPIAEVTSIDIRQALQPFERQRGNHNLVVTYIRSSWTWGAKYGRVPDVLSCPALKIDLKPSTPQRRRISEVEYASIQGAIDQLMRNRRNDPSRLLACAFVVYTGCRPVEAVRIRRDRVYKDRKIILLDDHKTYKRSAEPKVFHLTPEVLDIVERAESLHNARGDGGDYVFPRRGRCTASNWLAKTWATVQRVANVDLDLRHLRSGYINLAFKSGLSVDHVKEMTKHASSQTIERHYLVAIDERAAEHSNVVSGLIKAATKISVTA